MENGDTMEQLVMPESDVTKETYVARHHPLPKMCYDSFIFTQDD